jgi:hypothetical protein
MSLFPVLAQTATLADVRMWRSITGVLCFLTVAVTSVTITRWYVGYLNGKVERQRRIVEEFNNSHAEMQSKFQDQLDRLADCHQESQQDFQAYVALMSDIQTMILRDVIATIKNIEQIKGAATTANSGMMTTVSTVGPNIRALDGSKCDATDGGL